MWRQPSRVLPQEQRTACLAGRGMQSRCGARKELQGAYGVGERFPSSRGAAAAQALERSAAERRAQERRVEAARRAWAERWQPELEEDDEDTELDQGDAAALLAARPRRDAGVSQWAV